MGLFIRGRVSQAARRGRSKEQVWMDLVQEKHLILGSKKPNAEDRSCLRPMFLYVNDRLFVSLLDWRNLVWIVCKHVCFVV